jgi:hypothetical protein
LCAFTFHFLDNTFVFKAKKDMGALLVRTNDASGHAFGDILNVPKSGYPLFSDTCICA